MMGEPIMVMLVEDNLDHAELVMRTLENHRIANRIRHFTDGKLHWIIFAVRANFRILPPVRVRM